MTYRIVIFLLLFSVINNTLTQESAIDLSLPCIETKKYKSRMRKKTDKKKARKIYTYRDMNYEELIIAKDKQIEIGNYSSAIKYLEQIIKLCTDENKRSDHLLEIADVWFMDGEYEKAARMYSDFTLLYPGKEKAEYALYRAIASSFACILSPDRDQTKTEDTLALTHIFLKQELYVTYNEQVLEIQKKCQQHLVDSELNICNFYIKRGKVKQAQKRLDKVRHTWLTQLPSIEESLTFCQESITAEQTAQKEHHEKLIIAQNKKQKKIADRF